MMRSDDPFEKRLRQTPLATPPEHWRESILCAAEARLAQSGRTRRSWLNFFLHPRPASWLALAAVWILAFLFQTQTPSAHSKLSLAQQQPIEEALRERSQMIANAFRDEPPRAALPPRKTNPGPQSRSLPIWTNV